MYVSYYVFQVLIAILGSCDYDPGIPVFLNPGIIKCVAGMFSQVIFFDSIQDSVILNIHTVILICVEFDLAVLPKDRFLLVYSFWKYYGIILLLFSWPISVSQSHVYNREFVFHALHRGQRYTRLGPYLVKFTTFYEFLFYQIWGSSVLIPPPPPPLSYSRLLDPPPPSFPGRICFTLTLTSLWLQSASMLLVTISDSEPSLSTRLPTLFNKCLVGLPLLCPTGRPSAWGLATPNLYFW